MTSNKEKGDKFRDRVQEYFKYKECDLKPEYKVKVGFGKIKEHCFDLGNEGIVVECKRYDWTSSGNNPSAKISTLHEALLIFSATPTDYKKKMLFIPKTGLKGKRTPETLVDRYIRLHEHLIPNDVEIWEFDETNLKAEKKFPADP